MNVRQLRVLISNMKDLTRRMGIVEEKLGIKAISVGEKLAEKPPVVAKKKRQPAKPFPKQKK